jgi:hypothetical protein
MTGRIRQRPRIAREHGRCHFSIAAMPVATMLHVAIASDGVIFAQYTREVF